MTWRRWAALGAVLLTWAGTAEAEPQTSVALTLGGGAGELRSAAAEAVFHMGLRGDLLVLRDHNGQAGLGPYVEVLTRTFETFEAGGGLSVLVPLSESIPLVLSAGPFVRGFLPHGLARGGWDGGIAGHAFLGSRSHNFHSVYGWQLGGFVDLRVGVGPAKQLDVLWGLQIDMEVLGLPFLLLWNAFR